MYSLKQKHLSNLNTFWAVITVATVTVFLFSLSRLYHMEFFADSKLGKKTNISHPITVQYSSYNVLCLSDKECGVFFACLCISVIYCTLQPHTRRLLAYSQTLIIDMVTFSIFILQNSNNPQIYWHAINTEVLYKLNRYWNAAMFKVYSLR